MSFSGQNLPPLFQVILQGALHFVAEVDNGFIAAFAVYTESFFFEVYIIQVEPDAL